MEYEVGENVMLSGEPSSNVRYIGVFFGVYLYLLMFREFREFEWYVVGADGRKAVIL